LKENVKSPLLWRSAERRQEGEKDKDQNSVAAFSEANFFSLKPDLLEN